MARTLAPALAFASLLVAGTAVAASGAATATTAPGCIDTRDAAVGGGAETFVVETRPGDVATVAPVEIDTESSLAFLFIVR